MSFGDFEREIRDELGRMLGSADFEFDRDVAATGVRKVLQLEISVHPESWTQTLRGCGLLVVNPPFGFDTEAVPMLDWLARALAPAGAGGHRVRWLVPE